MANTLQRPKNVVLNLIIINALVFFAQLALDGNDGTLTNTLALFPYSSGLFKPYQLITHMFAHGGWAHILLNMYALWLFGTILERLWGSVRFLFFYLACGIAAGLTQMFLVHDSPAIGASGAIMGLIAAFAYLYPNTEFFIIPFPFPIKAKYMVALYALYDLFFGFRGGDDVAHFAHLGGLVTGFIIVIIWNQANKKKRY